MACLMAYTGHEHTVIWVCYGFVVAALLCLFQHQACTLVVWLVDNTQVCRLCLSPHVMDGKLSRTSGSTVDRSSQAVVQHGQDVLSMPLGKHWDPAGLCWT